MATHNHQVLKIKALEWLYLNAKCKYVTTELKIGKYIFDVIGSDGNRIFIIEAKQDINDFKRELNNPEDIKSNIKELKEQFLIDNDKSKYLENLKKARSKGIKFNDDILFKLSSHRYIIAPDGMIQTIPNGWGLLNEEPRVIERCKGNRVDKKMVNKVIRDICYKNSKIYLQNDIGVEFGKQIKFPDLNLI